MLFNPYFASHSLPPPSGYLTVPDTMEEKEKERMWRRRWSEEVERKKRGGRAGRGGAVNAVWEEETNYFYLYT